MYKSIFLKNILAILTLIIPVGSVIGSFYQMDKRIAQLNDKLDYMHKDLASAEKYQNERNQRQDIIIREYKDKIDRFYYAGCSQYGPPK